MIPACFAEVLPEVQWNGHLAHCLGLLTRGVASDLAMAVLLHELPGAEVQRIMERLEILQSGNQRMRSALSCEFRSFTPSAYEHRRVEEIFPAASF